MFYIYFYQFYLFICLQKQQKVILHISQCDAQLILPNAPAKELRRYVQGEYIYVPLKLENGCSSHVSQPPRPFFAGADILKVILLL